MRKGRILAILALIAGLSLMVFAGVRLREAQEVYKEGDSAYTDLRERVKGKSASASGDTTRMQAQYAYASTGFPAEIPKQDIDFKALRRINPDAAAWLYCPDTVIDYPVMAAEDYSYYLDHLPDGRWNANGSLFIDFNTASDFSSPLTVIYGHHMRSGKMFGGLEGYKKQGYFKQHPYLFLYTEEESYRIELVYGCVIGAGQWRDRAFMYAENLASLLAYAAYNTTFQSDAPFEEGDRFVALATCSYEFDDARYIVIGVLR